MAAPDGPRRELVPALPAEALRGLVISYRGYRDDAPAGRVMREPPSGVVPVIFDLGCGWRVSTPAAGYQPQQLAGFAAGMHDAHALVEPTGPTAGVQVDLSPLGARRLFGIPMHEITNRVAPLDRLLGGQAALLRERLGEGRSWAERFGILDEFLAGPLLGGGAVSPEVDWAWGRLASSGGAVPITRLGAELGWSRKQLVARFREEVGLTPKVTARVLRFEAMVARLRSGRLAGWAELALDCGYFDQSHLAREVRRLAGVTPRALLCSLDGGVTA
ncbi:MAG: AraC family transcriptional regulator [Candidatus Nephthysia bennettiae]|nr:helix-turn-helix transcriptional regulator [Candidatus Dormibacteraeota bacterium]PZR88820.1 MAG: AraC family transcriptional regulator [Candidatus Dormibacteraeota bacterium]